MKNFVKQTKRFFIIALVFVFSVSLVSPALAGSPVGMSVTATPTGVQNLYWGNLLSGSTGKFLTFTNVSDVFTVDASGNVVAAGKITPGAASGVCLSDGCKASWSSVGGLPAAVGTGNFLQTSGGAWVSQLIPAISSTYFTSLSGANLTNLPAGQLSGTIPAGTLGNSSVFIGTTAVPLNRTSGPLTLAGVTSALATALAANGTNCTAGNYPLGVDASGNAEGCTAAGGASQWTTNVNDIYNANTGNVGIGTTAPVAGSKLDVAGNITLSGYIAGRGAAGTALQIFGSTQDN